MQWLEEQPMAIGVSTSVVADLLILGADQGNLPEYPNREWGYGTLNVYRSLDRLRRL